MGYSLISWVSGIALGIEGYRFGHRYGDQKMCDLRCMFQVTRNSDKLHVAILLLDSGFGEASVTAQGHLDLTGHLATTQEDEPTATAPVPRSGSDIERLESHAPNRKLQS